MFAVSKSCSSRNVLLTSPPIVSLPDPSTHTQPQLLKFAMFFAVILAVDHDVVSWRSWFNRLPFTLRYGESNSQLASFGVFPRRDEVEELRQVMMGDEIDAEMYLVPQEMLDDFVTCFKQNTEADEQTQCMVERVEIVKENGHRIVTQLDVDEAQEDWYWWVPLF
ncbi:hypothetical protein PHSY_002895 [Pseudozyma hubeiensis SY62]|uniref:Uncharacterized protein n=1 Tax=Pseudozyma hubeiensis (strain SY62) TaxID=1305764 RepID=R9PB98_PSEHS|nr:hypothetical protein PHSY_002895 [Pseudozyma hubeiensis SY62]GAC95320.1 hypothetical protein PHSY_002895 [Pseudozyma hubeiensis SY62]